MSGSVSSLPFHDFCDLSSQKLVFSFSSTKPQLIIYLVSSITGSAIPPGNMYRMCNESDVPINNKNAHMYICKDHSIRDHGAFA